MLYRVRRDENGLIPIRVPREVLDDLYRPPDPEEVAAFRRMLAEWRALREARRRAQAQSDSTV